MKHFAFTGNGLTAEMLLPLPFTSFSYLPRNKTTP